MFYGRKCAEFMWTGGGNSLLFGIRSQGKHPVYIFGNHSETRFSDQFSTRKDILIDEPFVENQKYLFCFDSKLNRAIFVNKSKSYTWTYHSPPTKYVKFYIQQGSSGFESQGQAWFNYPFENTLPSGFFPLADPRSFDYVTCGMKSKHISFHMLVVYTILS